MRFGQATQIDRIDESESDESAAASDAKVGTPKQEMVEVAAEEDAAIVEQAIAIVGQAIAIAAAEEDAATVGQAIASVLGRDESLAMAIPMIPTSWGRRRDSARGGGSRSPAGKGGGCKMKMQDGKIGGVQLEVFDKILEVPSSIA